jgi:hypothetical protein
MFDGESSGNEEVYETNSNIYYSNEDNNENLTSKITIAETRASLSDMIDIASTCNLSKEEEDLVKGSLVNTRNYEKTYVDIEEFFFDIINKFGCPQLQHLQTMHTSLKK